MKAEPQFTPEPNILFITCQQLILNLRILIDYFFYELEVFDWDQNRQENTDLTGYFSKEEPNCSPLQQVKKCKQLMDSKLVVDIWWTGQKLSMITLVLKEGACILLFLS